MNPHVLVDSLSAEYFRAVGIGGTVVVMRDSDLIGWTIDKPAPVRFAVQRLHDEQEGGFYYSVHRVGGGLINGMEWDTAKTIRALRRLISKA